MSARNSTKSVVIDTNVFVSALTGSKNCKQIIDLFRADAFALVISTGLLLEITAVLVRPKFGLDKNNIEKILRFVRRKAIKVFPSDKVSVCRDPKDNLVLECAITGHTDFIVTGDKDLLTLKSFGKIAIITPRQFLKTLM